MLSKSQARMFFVWGTVLFSGLFLFLTVDTVRQVPALTKGQNITEAVARGKKIWDDNNCMGCHTLLGEGAYYAPELTKVYERRGAVWMDLFLKDPWAMYPGERKMVRYNFTDRDRQDLIAFFKWIGEMDLNGFPPRPSRMLAPEKHIKKKAQAQAPKASPTTRATTQATTQALPVPLAGIPKMPEKFQQLCRACHAFEGKGGVVGPALDGVANKYDRVSMEKWLSDPQAVKPGTAMPKLPMTAQEMKEMVDFLMAQR